MAKKSRFSDALAVEVAGGSTIREASKVAGCSESVAYHLSSTPEFRQRVNEIRSEIVGGAVGSLSSAAVEAVELLRSVLRDGSAKPGEKVAAARAILGSLAPISELCELRSRLDALEAANNRLKVVS